MVKLGWANIITKVSIMEYQMAMPREVHLEAVLHVFAFIHKKYNSTMEFYSTYPIINMIDFKEY